MDSVRPLCRALIGLAIQLPAPRMTGRSVWVFRHQEGDMVMLDVVFIALTLLFFVAAAAYVSACERIR